MGATGTTTIDMGAAPGTGGDVIKTITGQAGIIAGSSVEAWVNPVDSADHTVDEHNAEALVITAGNVVAGTGFDIYVQPGNGRVYGIFNLFWAWA